MNKIGRNYNVTFTAIPLAKYGHLKETGKDIVVYQLEKKDIGYLRYLLNNLQAFFSKFNINDDSTKQVIEEAFNASIKILKGENSLEKKAKILMSFYDGEPSSIIIGNLLKIDKKNRLHYSSRKNHAKNETELDWLATWNSKISGVGKVTVYEYFLSLIKDGFKQVFVRSELPEKSFAQKFYKSMGFKSLSDKPRLIQRENDNRYLIGQYDDLNDRIIPMKATSMNIKKVLDSMKENVVRKNFKVKNSINLEN